MKPPAECEWYARAAVEHGWSRNVLVHQIEADVYRRQGKALTNFKRTLPAPQSDLSRQVIKDPRTFDFLTLGAAAQKRDIEQGLVRHVARFLLELGSGIAFVAEQNYRRLSRHLSLFGEIPVPKSTAHLWVMASDCDKVTVDGKRGCLLVADGTGYKRRPDPKHGLDDDGPLLVVREVSGNVTVMPLGVWSGQSWSKIGAAIGPAWAVPIAEVLISDGEPGLAEGLGPIWSMTSSVATGIRDATWTSLWGWTERT